MIGFVLFLLFNIEIQKAKPQNVIFYEAWALREMRMAEIYFILRLVNQNEFWYSEHISIFLAITACRQLSTTKLEFYCFLTIPRWRHKTAWIMLIVASNSIDKADERKANLCVALRHSVIQPKTKTYSSSSRLETIAGWIQNKHIAHCWVFISNKLVQTSSSYAARRVMSK